MMQPDLFRSWGRASGRQVELFAANPAETDLHCDECGEYLVRTSSGYLCCPCGHGRLLEEGESNEYTGGLAFPDLEDES